MVPPAQHVGALALALEHRYTLTLQRTVHRGSGDSFWAIRAGPFALAGHFVLGPSHPSHTQQRDHASTLGEGYTIDTCEKMLKGYSYHAIRFMKLGNCHEIRFMQVPSHKSADWS